MSARERFININPVFKVVASKKCIICGAEAKFCIKGTSDCYCQECAEDNFSDISMLVKVEEEAQAVKRMVDNLLPEKDEDTEDQSE